MDVAFLRFLLSAGESFSLPLGIVWDHGFLLMPRGAEWENGFVLFCRELVLRQYVWRWLSSLHLAQATILATRLAPCFFCRTTEGSFGSLGRCSNKLVESPVMWCVAIFRVRNFVSVHVCLFSNFTRYVKSAGLWSGQQLLSVSRSDSL